jgi:hypothetical protein
MGGLKRRILEPRDTFDRVLYAGLALNGPVAAIYSIRSGKPDVVWAGWIMAAWSAVATLYTIEWAIVSYRKWRARRC